MAMNPVQLHQVEEKSPSARLDESPVDSIRATCRAALSPWRWGVETRPALSLSILTLHLATRPGSAGPSDGRRTASVQRQHAPRGFAPPARQGAERAHQFVRHCGRLVTPIASTRPARWMLEEPMKPDFFTGSSSWLRPRAATPGLHRTPSAGQTDTSESAGNSI